MRERAVERHLVKRAKQLGGRAYKLTSPGRRNMPDRMVLLPVLGLWFVETKRPGKDATAAQAREHDRMRKVGARVVVLNTKERVDAWFKDLAALSFAQREA